MTVLSVLAAIAALPPPAAVFVAYRALSACTGTVYLSGDSQCTVDARTYHNQREPREYKTSLQSINSFCIVPVDIIDN